MFATDTGFRKVNTINGDLVANSTVDETRTVDADGSSATIRVETFPDGSQRITTTTETGGGPLCEPDIPSSRETTVTAVSSDGRSAVVYHELFRSSTNESTGTSSGYWELTYTGNHGQTFSERSGWAVDANGNSSKTVERTTPDGTTTVTTTTLDANGVGTETTTLDANGVGTETTTTYNPDGTQTTTTTQDPGGTLARPDRPAAHREIALFNGRFALDRCAKSGWWRSVTVMIHPSHPLAPAAAVDTTASGGREDDR
ncbi:hypothetical protein [Nonomuraea sp. NPDC048916]|uniref:hypothetical protein n=1 Tax=Nonomuraea sp. NPDC048916 TaxID=3154232 RepID=UPI0033C25BEF